MNTREKSCISVMFYSWSDKKKSEVVLLILLFSVNNYCIRCWKISQFNKLLN